MGKSLSGHVVYFVRIALCTALTVVLSWVSIPFVPPFTLQLLAITLTLYLFGGMAGFLSTLLYLLMGAVGLPVFSGFGCGVGYLFSATGGFLFGFLAYCLVYAMLCRLFGECGCVRLVWSVAGLAVLYFLGSTWYTFIYLSEGSEAYFASLTITVLPFIIPDIIKILVAYVISARLENAIPRSKKR